MKTFYYKLYTNYIIFFFKMDILIFDKYEVKCTTLPLRYDYDCC